MAEAVMVRGSSGEGERWSRMGEAADDDGDGDCWAGPGEGGGEGSMAVGWRIKRLALLSVGGKEDVGCRCSQSLVYEYNLWVGCGWRWR